MGHRKAKNKIRCSCVTKMSNSGEKAALSARCCHVDFAAFGKLRLLQRSDVQRLFGNGDVSSGKSGVRRGSKRFSRLRQP
jgi:hypothetical protein